MRKNGFLCAMLALMCVSTAVFSAGQNELRWPISEDPSSLDPPAAYGNTAIQIAQNLFDGLTELNNQMEVVPALAERWSISDDGTVYTFYLRKDAKFHTGKPVTASDVKYSWERALWKETGSYSTWLMYPITGAAAVESGETRELAGVKVIDDHTFEVTLGHPAGYFLGLTSRWQYFVVDRETVEKYGKDWTKAGNLVGSGAYKMTEWVEGDHVTIEANEDYWGGKPSVERVVMPIIPDVSTSMLRYEAGEVDAVSDLTAADVKRFSSDAQLKDELQVTPILRVTWLGFNWTMPPFAGNKALREAVAYGIDRKRLVNVVFQGVGMPAYSFLPPGMPCFNADLKPYYFDLDKAKEKMAEAGFPEGKGLENQKIVLSVSEQRDRVASFEFVQAQLLANLGIKAEIEIIPGKSYGGRLMAHDLQLFRGSMGADYPDPQEFMEYLAMTGKSTNFGQYTNERLDELTLVGNKEVDLGLRCEAYGEAEEIFLTDVGIVPLFYNAQTAVVKPYVKGFQYTPLYVVPFKQVSIER